MYYILDASAILHNEGGQSKGKYGHLFFNMVSLDSNTLVKLPWPHLHGVPEHVLGGCAHGPFPVKSDTTRALPSRFDSKHTHLADAKGLLGLAVVSDALDLLDLPIG